MDHVGFQREYNMRLLVGLTVSILRKKGHHFLTEAAGQKLSDALTHHTGMISSKTYKNIKITKQNFEGQDIWTQSISPNS